jgi:hypothetical protein
MPESEAIVIEIQQLRRAKRRWKITAICALAALTLALPIEALNTTAVMHQIKLDRDRALQAEQQTEMQREESFRLLLDLAQEATRQSQKANATTKPEKEMTPNDAPK